MKKAKILEYTVLFEPSEAGGYVVTVPKLYGLTTQGETFGGAKVMAKDAIKVYIESLVAHGKEVPVEDAKEVVSLRVAVPVDLGQSNPVFA